MIGQETVFMSSFIMPAIGGRLSLTRESNETGIPLRFIHLTRCASF